MFVLNILGVAPRFCGVYLVFRNRGVEFFCFYRIFLSGDEYLRVIWIEVLDKFK